MFWFDLANDGNPEADLATSFCYDQIWDEMNGNGVNDKSSFCLKSPLPIWDSHSGELLFSLFSLIINFYALIFKIGFFVFFQLYQYSTSAVQYSTSAVLSMI